MTERDLVLAPTDAPARDVTLDFEAGCRVEELADMAARLVGREADEASPALWHARSERWLDPASPVSALGLRRGDVVLVADRRRPRTAAAARDHGRYELAVVSGPDCGRTFPLTSGEHVIGRSARASIVLSDPAVSRRHCMLAVDARSVRLTAAWGPVRVEDRAAAPSDAVVCGELMRIGATGLLVRVAGGSSRDRPVEEGGRIRFNRPPRPMLSKPVRRVELPAPPSPPRRPRLSVAAAAAPLLMGALFFALTRSPFMLLFMTLSPVVAVGTFLEDRRRGRSGHRREVGGFRVAVERAAVVAEGLRREERDARRAQFPDPAALVARVLRHAPDLWSRRGTDADFLVLRVGWHRAASAVELVFAPGGDDALREEARRRLVGAGDPPLVPAVVDLAPAGSIGLAGPPPLVHALAGWLVTQVAAEHSPRDVELVVAVDLAALERWDWAKWLPHVAVGTTGAPRLALGSSAAAGLLGRLDDLVARRAAEARSLGGVDAMPARVVAVLDEEAELDLSAVSRVLSGGPAVGVHAIWLGRDPRDLPGECGTSVVLGDDGTAIVRRHRQRCEESIAMSDRLDPSNRPELAVEAADHLAVGLERRVALALAPLVDATAPGVGAVPRAVALLDVLGLPGLTASAVLERWRTERPGLVAIVGVGVDGKLSTDLVIDGPHALVAGTTGSGKSELLRAVVASLAVTYPPERCTFLLIDYKGGAAFGECVRLPHCVGLVTDLDDHLAARVLTSLRAEVRRREQVLRAAGVAELAELAARDPDAPPRLVIVVDEFAALAREVPDFVDGVVDIAQRGRSLGLHLVLATQRPSGVVGGHIRANMNLRIALRVQNPADSIDVVDVDDAARIPRFLPGRAFVRTGHADLAEVQCAYAGGVRAAAPPLTAPSPAAPSGHAIRCRELVFGGDLDRDGDDAVAPQPGPTDLGLLVDAAVAAHAARDGRPVRRPWLPPLPRVVTLRECTPECTEDPGSRDPARRVAIGLLDEPARQRRHPFSVDFEIDGSLLVFGTGRSGKTTALRAVAAACAAGAGPEDVHLYALDFGGHGLAALEALPQCGAVIAGEDTERVAMLLERLEVLARDRAALLARLGVATVGECLARGLEPVARVVVLLDGYPGFIAAFERVDFGEWLERVHRLATGGRPVGIHFVITADRRGSVPAALLGGITTRVVLRQADRDDAVALGVPPGLAASLDRPPGRGVVREHEVQLALPDGGEGSREVRSDGSRLGRLPRSALSQSVLVEGARRAPGVEALPDRVRRVALPPPTTAVRPSLGAGECRGRDRGGVAVDLANGPFLVSGPPGSGRTAALHALAVSAASAGDGDVWLLEPRASAGSAPDPRVRWAVGVDPCLTALQALCAPPPDAAATRPQVVLVDDLGDLLDLPAATLLEELARRGPACGVYLVAAVDAFALTRTFAGCLSEIRRRRHGLLLQPDLETDGDAFGVRLRARPGQRFPPGRGFVVARGSLTLVQVAGE
ncbi:MAG: FtsK/SpoIIIE domain-containing protein [Acidimicrobiia bacterium]